MVLKPIRQIKKIGDNPKKKNYENPFLVMGTCKDSASKYYLQKVSRWPPSTFIPSIFQKTKIIHEGEAQ